jgi:hypothetical protein
MSIVTRPLFPLIFKEKLIKLFLRKSYFLPTKLTHCSKEIRNVLKITRIIVRMKYGVRIK